MSGLHSILANAIDFGMVLNQGLTVLVPLMLFQVGVESLVLRRIWRGSFNEMAAFTLAANCWSLAAGIPTKILNAAFYDAWLPRDLPGFFSRYPSAVGIGTLAYFVVTFLVELAWSRHWRRTKRPTLSQAALVKGILLANMATYVVLAPIHYLATRPNCDVQEFTSDTRWPSQPETQVVFVDSKSGHLKSLRLDGSVPETLVPMPVIEYLLSPDARVCLFRQAGGNLILYRRGTGETHRIWQTDERFSMDQAAFSPLAERVAFVSATEDFLEVLDVRTAGRVRQQLRLGVDGSHVVWSPEESKFFVSQNSTERFAVTITPDFSLVLSPLARTNELRLLTCYGRVGSDSWWNGGGEWVQSFSTDICGDLRAWAVRGLGKSLRIYRDVNSRERVFTIAVNPGLLRFGRIHFDDVAFLDGCGACVFDAEGKLYLLELERKRLSTLADGERFILMTPRYQKNL